MHNKERVTPTGNPVTTQSLKINYSDSVSQFKDAMRRYDITPPREIVDDGKLHRFSSNGKSGNDAGWYVFYNGNIPAGAFGDWRTGTRKSWRADIGREWTKPERAVYRAQIQNMRLARQAEETTRQTEATRQGMAMLDAASLPKTDQPYLNRKGVRAVENLREIELHQAISILGYHPQAKGEFLTGRLLLAPVQINGTVSTIEMIDEHGRKSAIFGGKKSGGFWCAQSLPEGDGSGQALLIGEGVATVLSCHEATEYPAIAALSSGNLSLVAQSLRKRYAAAKLIILADLIKETGEPDLKAIEAARSIGGFIAVPDFGADRPKDKKDFNDLHVRNGLRAIAACIESATYGMDVTDVTSVQSNDYMASIVTANIPYNVTNVTDDKLISIPESDRPCFRVFDEEISIPESSYKLKPGVWYFGIKHIKNNEPPSLTQQWVCSPLYVEAITFDGLENNFGRQLRFRNSLRRWHEWAMPMDLLRGSGDDLRGELLALGVEIDPQAKTLLSQYLQSGNPEKRVHCALQVGWCGNSFVLPDKVIGPQANDVIFQSGERGHHEHTQAGTMEGWQTDIAALAVGNPALTFAICAAFAGPLLYRCNAESGGFHLVGDSSTGKTTAIEVACSVWGGADFRRSWRATSNGMEGVAALFNDCLLALDEISECDPKEVGAIIYALGNGTGKQRASRTGRARSVTRWRCSVLSSGERTIATTMDEGGYRTKAGQAMRLMDIPVTRSYGAWDDLHGAASSAAFSDNLKRAAITHYGHAGRAFLEKLTRDERDLCELLDRIKALPDFLTENGQGQDKRGVARFALLALAGELATEFGLTGWPEEAAIQAAAEMFRVWRSTRAPGNNERQQILEKLANFIDRHGDGRFSNASLANEVTIIRDRAGWWRDDGGNGRIYLFNKDGLREALKGFDFNRALDTLQEAGVLPKPESRGERAKPQRIGGRPVRVYQIYANKLEVSYGS